MTSGFSILIALAAVAFCVALLAVVTQWLKADEAAAATEIGIQASLRTLDQGASLFLERPVRRSSTAGTFDHAMPGLDRGTGVPRPRPDEEKIEVAQEQPETVYHLPAIEVENPERLSDDTTALSRLFCGWGAGGLAVGMGLGAAMYGYVGALLGAVLLSTAAIGGVVVVVALLDRARARAKAEPR